MSGAGMSLEMKGICKSFHGVQVLHSVDFSAMRGEIHALVGENGAGKSTLMRIAAGAETMDSGAITVMGRRCTSLTPSLSRNLGVGIVYQEFVLAPHLSVAENIFLGRLPRKPALGVVDWRALYARTQRLLSDVGFDVKPEASVGSLSVACRQMVEISKALSYDAKILIMDEPTATLVPTEVEKLFRLLRRLKEQGVTVIYVSHRLDEVLEISDRVTVMKDGQVVGTRETHTVTKDMLIRMMIGREIRDMFPKRDGRTGEELLRVEEATLGTKLQGVSLVARKGEILGIAGLVGSGRTELARVIFGAEGRGKAKVWIRGKLAAIRSPKDAVRLGVGLLPEDRVKEGLVVDKPVRENMTLANIGSIASAGMIRFSRERTASTRLAKQLDVRCNSVEERTSRLSGGNKQKVVVAKWVYADSDVMIFDEPTKGVDVGAKAQIHGLMRMLANQGRAIVMISSELPEIVGMSDRVLVMCRGKVSGELTGDDITEENIMRLAVMGEGATS